MQYGADLSDRHSVVDSGAQCDPDDVYCSPAIQRRQLLRVTETQTSSSLLSPLLPPLLPCNLGCGMVHEWPMHIIHPLLTFSRSG